MIVYFLFILLVYSELLFLSVGLLFTFHIRGILFLSCLWVLDIFLYLRVGKLKI